MGTKKSISGWAAYAIENAQLSQIMGGCAQWYWGGATNWGDPDKCTFDAIERAEDGTVLQVRCDRPDSEYNQYFCDRKG